ncbi:RND superfamily putative drug exporter [Actinoplanes lutulentus]|uniref:RND superfamily putative drug exporter n=1 Tax=Actinoplanes lutulentus TaxID=1287878 RepID=A0A327ZA52_9ACTN|nr:MMPL family transporter [Actinoplanes lutulentus]MBB2943353.1 RND superfamily putative drug exporter [Actinoplanes lutulentus]RAK28411.1 RND superfamily putative drug exporter [Actinoplanes lutulentus]
MATLLYRLGRFSFRRRRLTLAVWVIVLALLGLGANKLSGPTTDAFSIPGTESSRAMDVLAEKFGGSSEVASAKVVFTVTGDTKLTGAAQKAAIENAIARLETVPDVAAVTDPFDAKTVSQDLQTGYATVTYSVAATDVSTADREALLAAGDTAKSAGIAVEYSGEVTNTAEESHAAEAIGIVVAALVLLITFGSLVAAGLPLLTALVGVGIGMLGIQIATGFLDLSSSTSALATMLGLAVGIDYALFVVSRYRGEIAAGRDGEEAAGRAAGTAGSAVVFAGLTVIIALAALSVTGIPFLTAMGVAAAGTVAFAVLVTLSLVPAVLGFAGRKILPKKQRNAGQHEKHTAKTPFGERWARGVLRHRVLALLLPLGVIAVVALPALDLRLALPDDSTAAVDSTQRKAYDQLAEGFGAGFNGPLIVVVEAGTGNAKTAAEQAQKTIAALDDVATVVPATANQAGDTAILTVIPASAPTSEATKDLVHDIRDHATTLTGVTLAVTGTTAINIDISEKLSAALVPYLAIVVGLAFILLMLVFRSILVPLKATVGFLLSVAAAFGALVFIFQQGHLADLIGLESTGPIVSVMPIFLIGILFGLAMDYEVFLVTRTREEFVHGAAPNDAVVTGMSHGARVVTAAALIMMSVFSGFILADDTIIKSLGFALAFGVAVDAFLVRMTIVPTVLSLLGKAAWWLPRWLDKILPNVDVEGEQLTKQLAAADREHQEKHLVTTTG